MASDLASNPLLVVILGPTASGKSSLAIILAKHFGGEVVSCDSVAVYREFEIGTAKPSRAERALVPHHLVDVAEPGETFTAGEYARQARAAISDISSRGNLPIVVGGTGLYLRALLDGLFPDHNVQKTCASASATGQLGTAPHTFIASSPGLTGPPLRRFTPTTHPS